MNNSRIKIGRSIVSVSSPFDSLPEDCISNVISFTNPRGACVVASVSKTFNSAAKSDIVWEKFLPPEYPSLIPPSRVFSSKKELYLALCDDPVLIENGKKSLWLEKATGKKCVMLSAMSLSITWGDTLQYWQWITVPETRFEKVAELMDVCWFEIRGRIYIRGLSPRTRYSAYIVFKRANQCYGFENVAIEAGVGVVGEEATKRLIGFGKNRRRGRGRRNLVKPEEREDGWMEIELGDFVVEGELTNSDEIEMSVLETKQLHWKRGLIIHGIEIRPSKIQ
ncbi:hypothetical protein AALP_AA5G013300 [Arabis alpina]|uniref:F-box domain-containing protein n=1 Tax=Arabis alpina TaxID=50452 RepID=A0A087GU83_ARAAL|nr:hypothetical protein AALP_AA5G013300 [Arabis alpina]